MNVDQFLDDAKKRCKDEGNEPVAILLQHKISGKYAMMAVSTISDRDLLALLKASTESHAREMLAEAQARAKAKIISLDDPNLKPLG